MFGRKKRAAKRRRDRALEDAEELAFELNTVIYEHVHKKNGGGVVELRRLLYDAGDDELADIVHGTGIEPLFWPQAPAQVRAFVRQHSQRLFEREMQQFGLSGGEEHHV